MARYDDIENTLFKGVGDEDRWYGGSLRFSWDSSTEEIIKRLGFGKKLHKYMADVVSLYCEEFVPYEKGDLNAYVQTFGSQDHGTITYQRPYASKQYYLSGGGYSIPNNSRRTTTFHPLATSFWDKHAWNMYKDEITQAVDDERIKLCRTQE